MTPDEHDAMDAYSTVVVRVAELVLPSVASLRVRTRRGEGGGSASVLTADGFLLTSAHVVAGASAAEVAFADGTEVNFDRYTISTHEMGQATEHHPQWRPVCEIVTRRGAYVGTFAIR